ncbi:MAG: hypothetical protein ABI346_03290 [Candidatus Baltobacteraceae bacterium]
MIVRTLGTLAVGATVVFLSGCGGGSSSLARSGPNSLPAAQQRAAAPPLGAATYPIGAVNGKTPAQLRAGSLQRGRGWISPDAGGPNALLYVANLGGNSVEIFQHHGANQTPMGTITNGINFPAGMTIDNKGNLYVVNEGANNVTVYPRGQISPSLTYTTDLSTATDVAVAHDGTVYISNFNGLANGWVSVYPQGNTSNEYRISDFNGGAPLGVALDSSGNLYVQYDLNGSGNDAVNEYAPGSTTGTNLHLVYKFGGSVRVDGTGDILVAQQVQPSAILVFPPGATQASQSITFPDNGQPFALAVNRKNMALFAGDSTSNTEAEFAYPSGTYRYAVAGGFNNPSGVAVSPSQFK